MVKAGRIVTMRTGKHLLLFICHLLGQWSRGSRTNRLFSSFDHRVFLVRLFEKIQFKRMPCRTNVFHFHSLTESHYLLISRHKLSLGGDLYLKKSFISPNIELMWTCGSVTSCGFILISMTAVKCNSVCPQKLPTIVASGVRKP